jgi:hypothetical protein
MASGYITIDYRMFCDLISIARCGSDTINDKKSDKILSALENNVLGYTNEEKSKFMMSFSEYKKLKNKY